MWEERWHSPSVIRGHGSGARRQLVAVQQVRTVPQRASSSTNVCTVRCRTQHVIRHRSRACTQEETHEWSVAAVKKPDVAPYCHHESCAQRTKKRASVRAVLAFCRRQCMHKSHTLNLFESRAYESRSRLRTGPGLLRIMAVWA